MSNPRFILVACAISGIAGLAVLGTKAISMIQQGRGKETYRTAWGYEFSWVALTISFVACVAALVIALVWRWREERQWAVLEAELAAKQNPPSPTTTTRSR